MTVFGLRGSLSDTSYATESHAPLIREVITFFKTRRSPVPPEETVEIIAFLEAANLSAARQGEPVSLPLGKTP
jgi:hypothetical protein